MAALLHRILPRIRMEIKTKGKYQNFWTKSFVNLIMATTIKKPRKTRIQKLLKKADTGKPKNPSAFFGKLKDEVDGLSLQKKLRNEWR